MCSSDLGKQQHGSKYITGYNINITNITSTTYIFHIYLPHMIHKSLTKVITSVAHIKNSLLYHPRFISQSLVRNRSQQHRKRDILSQHRSPWRAQLLAWREITGLSRHGGRFSCLAKSYRYVAMAS